MEKAVDEEEIQAAIARLRFKVFIAIVTKRTTEERHKYLIEHITEGEKPLLEGCGIERIFTGDCHHNGFGFDEPFERVMGIEVRELIHRAFGKYSGFGPPFYSWSDNTFES